MLILTKEIQRTILFNYQKYSRARDEQISVNERVRFSCLTGSRVAQESGDLGSLRVLFVEQLRLSKNCFNYSKSIEFLFLLFVEFLFLLSVPLICRFGRHLNILFKSNAIFKFRTNKQ